MFHGRRLERNQTRVTGVVDSISATTVMVNNIEHTYKSGSREAQEDDVAMVNITVDGVKGC